jgi:integrase/recombinase XerD
MATFTIYLYKQRKLKKNLYNLTIRVIVGNDVQFLNIARMTENQYKQVFEKNAMDDKSIEFRHTCNGYINKCERIFAEMRTYNKKRFRELFFEKDREIPKSLKVKDLFQYYIDSKPDLKLRTKLHYRMTGSIFDTFKNGLVVEDITPDFLKKFEKSKLVKGCSLATIDTYNRNLRSVINYFTHEMKLIPKD